MTGSQRTARQTGRTLTRQNRRDGQPTHLVDEPRTRPGETLDLVDKVHPPSRAQRQGTSNRTRGNPRPSRQGTSDQAKGRPPSPVDEPRTRPGETPDLVDKVYPPSRAQRQGASDRTRGNPRPSRQRTSDQAKGRPPGPVDEPQTMPGETPDLVDKVHPPVGD
eukprot:SAG11_NODE_1316_length_5219_cov_47.375708_3_plen_163_part_00